MWRCQLPVNSLWLQRLHAALWQTVLLCGWGETTFMADLLHELDHGPAALPADSSVTLLNTRPGVDILGDRPAHDAPESVRVRSDRCHRSWSTFTACRHPRLLLLSTVTILYSDHLLARPSGHVWSTPLFLCRNPRP